MKKYRVKLSASNHEQLLELVRKGKATARVINRARILLLARAGKTDKEIADALHISPLMLHNIRRRFQTEGLDLLYDQPRSGQPCKPDGKAEARLTAIACSTPPRGRARWSLRLLAEELVRLEVVDTISHKTVGQVQKNDLQPWQKQQWCLAKLEGEYLARMEDVLDLYEQPYDSRRPVICIDERPCQLLGDLIAPLPMKPGCVRKENYHDKREGTCCILIAFEPLTGRRIIQLRSHRTKRDSAQFMKTLVEKHYPNVERIRLVQDFLNTHSAGAFYETFDAETAHDHKINLSTTTPRRRPVGSTWLRTSFPFWANNAWIVVLRE